MTMPKIASPRPQRKAQIQQTSRQGMPDSPDGAAVQAKNSLIPPKNPAQIGGNIPEFSRISATGRNAASVAAGAMAGAQGRVSRVPDRSDPKSLSIQAKGGSSLKSNRGFGVGTKPSARHR